MTQTYRILDQLYTDRVEALQALIDAHLVIDGRTSLESITEALARPEQTADRIRQNNPETVRSLDTTRDELIHTVDKLRPSHYARSRSR